MTYLLKNPIEQAQFMSFSLFGIGIFLIATLFSGHLLAKELTFEQYKSLHESYQSHYKSEPVSVSKSQAGMSKFLMGGKEVRVTPILDKTEALKNNHVIDHHIFASPKNTRTAKRIAV